MSAELIVRKFYDAYNDGNPSGVTELFSEGAVVEYVGGIEPEGKRLTCRCKDEIAQLFGEMFRKSKERLGAAVSCPKTILVQNGIVAVEFLTILSDRSGASFKVRGVQVFEIEDNKIEKLTLYLPTPTEKPFVLADRLSVKDLGELSAIAWAIV